VIYFDTTYIVKCYLNEHGSAAVRSLAAKSERLACCAWGRLEFAATVHRKLREGTINAAENRLVLNQFDSDDSDHIWTWLPATPELLAATVAKFRSLKPSAYLRSADALHLACAAEHGFKEIWSNDRHLLAAAPAFNIKGRNVIAWYRGQPTSRSAGVY
jgi:predicted nucleic acid-binding protein